MNICRTSSGKGKCSTQQLRLLPAYLFMRLEYGIDKFLIRDLTLEMPLGHIIVYLELDVLEKFLADSCPDMERWIPVVGDIDAYKFGTG